MNHISNNSQPLNPFAPFGENVRVGTTNVIEGDIEILACLQDLCALHKVDLKQALHLDYPNGSIAMLNQDKSDFNNCAHLTEQAYSVFMAWVNSDCEVQYDPTH
jgi:hypothetical protein